MTRYPAPISEPLAIQGDRAECLPEIFRDEVNLAIWSRSLTPKVQQFIQSFVQKSGKMERFQNLGQNDTAATALPKWALEMEHVDQWLADVDQIIAMYRCLFEPDAVGLRLHVIDSTMCPRFHVDRVPARLLCTYQGTGTEWLPEAQVTRPRSPGPLPEQDPEEQQIQRIPTGAIALLKGEAWEGNEGRGLVHRSPAPTSTPRLVIGLDWLAS